MKTKIIKFLAQMPVYVFGSNSMNQLGLPGEADSSHLPRELEVFRDKKVLKVACGKLHTLVLCEGGELYSWGVNDDCALGRDGNECVPALVPSAPRRIASISAGASHSAVLSENGWVYGCGTFKEPAGKVGFSINVKMQPSFVRIGNLRGMRMVASGFNHLVMVDKSNGLWTVGANNMGQLGYVPRKRQPKRCLEPELILSQASRKGGAAIAAVAGGEAFSHFSTAAGECFAWGANYNGQLGNGNSEDTVKRTKVGVEGAVHISAGHSHTLFLTAAGDLYGCGDNSSSQLGLKGIRATSEPKLVLAGVSKAETGTDFCMALVDGKLVSWGLSLSGETGHEDDCVEEPREIDFPFGKVIDFACGNDFTVVLTE